MKKLLITGGNGFIGSHLIDNLSENGYQTVSFDVSERKTPQPYNTSWIKGDITNFNDFKTIDDLEGIIHLAAVSRTGEGVKNPLRCMNLNVMGTMNILELARNIKDSPWVILAGTNEAVKNIYAFSKQITELSGKIYVENYGLNALSLRFANVYGSSRQDKEKFIPKLILKALNNQDIFIDNPKRQFDIIYIKDAIGGICSGIKYLENIQKSYFDKIPICTGKLISLEDLANLIIKETTSKSKIKMGKKKIEYLKLSPVKAKNILNFQYNIDIKTGIKKTIQDFLKDQ